MQCMYKLEKHVERELFLQQLYFNDCYHHVYHVISASVSVHKIKGKNSS